MLSLILRVVLLLTSSLKSLSFFGNGGIGRLEIGGALQAVGTRTMATDLRLNLGERVGGGRFVICVQPFLLKPSWQSSAVA